MFVQTEKPPHWQEFSLILLGKTGVGGCGYSLSVSKKWMIEGTKEYIEWLWSVGRIDWDKMLCLIGLVDK